MYGLNFFHSCDIRLWSLLNLTWNFHSICTSSLCDTDDVHFRVHQRSRFGRDSQCYVREVGAHADGHIKYSRGGVRLNLPQLLETDDEGAH